MFPSSTLLGLFFSLHFSLTSSVPPTVGHRSAHPPLLPFFLSKCSTHLHPQPHFPAHTVSSSTFSPFHSLSPCCTLGVCYSPGHPSPQQCDRLPRLRSGACCSRTQVYMLMASVFLCVLSLRRVFVVGQHS